MTKFSIWKPSLAACALTLTMSCGTGTTGDPDPTENPEDYTFSAVSESCGGKCDSPDALLNAYAERRLLSQLEIADAIDEPESQELLFSGEVLEEHLEDVTEDTVLNVTVAAVDGASNPDFKVEGELPWDTGEEAFFGVVDTSELIPWQLIEVEVSGTVGEREINQIFEFAPGSSVGAEYIPQPEDPWADAKNVELGVIQLNPDIDAPDYEYPQVDGDFGLGGTEFWQRWPGGENPTFSYSAGTDFGRKCMYASARRFEAVMNDPPPAMVQLLDESNWRGRFFNWNDDFSHEEATRRPTGAVLWAWRTGLIKWISQTGADGSCFLPTYSAVERAAEDCLATAERDDGEIQGCQGY